MEIPSGQSTIRSNAYDYSSPPSYQHFELSRGSGASLAENPAVKPTTYRNDSQLPQNDDLNCSEDGRHLVPPETESGAPAPTAEFRSRLSPLAQRFVLIPRGDFAACQAFISQENAILSEDPNTFLQEALQAYCSGQRNLARSCGQSAYLISKCSLMTRDGRREYFKDLQAKKKSALTTFWDDLDKIDERVIAQAQLIQRPLPKKDDALNTGQHVPSSQKLVAAMGGVNLSPKNFHNTFTPTNLVWGQKSGGSHSGSRSSNQQIGFPAPIPENNVSPSSRHNPFTTQPEPQQSGPRSRQTSDRKPTTRSRESRQSLSNLDVKGTDGDEEQLDPRYRKRADPIAFFVVGRLFAILWHENAGRSKKPKEDFGQTPLLTRGKYGEWIFSHIRRMVVVRQRHGYCWCIPINTYGGRGVEKNMSANEAEAHTIIYSLNPTPQPLRVEQRISQQSQTGPILPQPLPTEQKMTKIPIAVIMAENHILEPMSRLNFAKVFTVEHNVKVMEIGRVAPISMPWLEGYWRNEAAGPSSNPT